MTALTLIGYHPYKWDVKQRLLIRKVSEVGTEEKRESCSVQVNNMRLMKK